MSAEGPHGGQSAGEFDISILNKDHQQVRVVRPEGISTSFKDRVGFFFDKKVDPQAGGGRSTR